MTLTANDRINLIDSLIPNTTDLPTIFNIVLYNGIIPQFSNHSIDKDQLRDTLAVSNWIDIDYVTFIDDQHLVNAVGVYRMDDILDYISDWQQKNMPRDTFWNDIYFNDPVMFKSLTGCDY